MNGKVKYSFDRIKWYVCSVGNNLLYSALDVFLVTFYFKRIKLVFAGVCQNRK